MLLGFFLWFVVPRLEADEKNEEETIAEKEEKRLNFTSLLKVF